MERKQELKEEITRWRGIQQHVVDRSLSQDEELALIGLIQLWLDDLSWQAGDEPF